MTPYENALRELVRSNEDIVVMTAENRAPILRIIPELGNKFVDVGIAEQTLIGMSAGLALRGRKPIVHALAAFLTMRSFEFIRSDIGIPGLPVIMVGFIPGFLSDANGPTHQAIEDVGLMRLIPGINIFCPSSQNELACALPELVASQQPWYVRFVGDNVEVHSSYKELRLPFRSAVQARPGKDIALLTYGPLLSTALETAKLLEREEVSVEVVHTPVLKPFDNEFLLNLFEQFPMIVTIEDHFGTGGLSTIVSERLAQYAFIARRNEQSIPFHLPITLQDRWFHPARISDVLEYERYTPTALRERILNVYRKELAAYAK